MTREKAVTEGLIGNQISKHIIGTDEVSAGITTVAAGAGAVTGSVESGANAAGASALGLAVAPVIIPVAVLSGLVAGIASFFG